MVWDEMDEIAAEGQRYDSSHVVANFYAPTLSWDENLPSFTTAISR